VALPVVVVVSAVPPVADVAASVVPPAVVLLADVVVSAVVAVLPVDAAVTKHLSRCLGSFLLRVRASYERRG
jgi:hypothetical protein